MAVAARRTELLTELADRIGGTAFELDVENPSAISTVVGAAADALDGIDAVVFTSTVVPFAHIEDTDVTTWLHAFTVNAVGANSVLRAALPYLSDTGVVLIASSLDVGRPRAGVSAYSASKAALDEILHSWRSEHPELSIVRVGIGPTADTEIPRAQTATYLLCSSSPGSSTASCLRRCRRCGTSPTRWSRWSARRTRIRAWFPRWCNSAPRTRRTARWRRAPLRRDPQAFDDVSLHDRLRPSIPAVDRVVNSRMPRSQGLRGRVPAGRTTVTAAAGGLWE